MTSFLSFTGRMGPVRYALWSAAAFISQHLLVLLVFKANGYPLPMDWAFYVAPLRSLVTCNILGTSACTFAMPAIVLILACAYLLLVCWVLAALAFRRAADAGISAWIAAFAMAPIIQLPVIACLSVFPSRSAPEESPMGTGGAMASRWTAAVHGVGAGLGVTLLAVAVGTLIFGNYGYGVFVVSPFIVGAIAAYVANRTQDIGAGPTAKIVAGATAIGGMGLVAAALEGIICILLAAPLGFGVALIGGLLGRSVAQSSRRPARQVLSGLAVLPMVFAFETIMPPAASFDTVQTIEIDAPPAAVWNAVVRMDSMDEPQALAFRFGLAYPIRGEVLGEGVGAVRRGEFSTGTAIERVTEWAPERKLAFVVEQDVPAMRELSPYEHVHAPHAVGYFRTTLTSFELLPRAGGTTIVERTSHVLRIDPAFYWLPMARWIVHENNARVLAHIRRQAEQGSR